MNKYRMTRGILRNYLAALAAFGFLWLQSNWAGAAVSDGPILTNACALRQHQTLLFDQAIESNQDRLRVGQERYERKQLERAKMLQAMAAQLQMRRRTVALQSALPAGGLAVTMASWQKPVFATLLPVVFFVCAGFIYRQRVADKKDLSQE